MSHHWINTLEWDEAEKYWRAFWAGELLDRPPILLSVPMESPLPLPQAPDDKTRWSDPDFLLKRNQVLASRHICMGERLHVSDVMMSAWEATAYGCPVTYKPNGIWIEPSVSDWDSAPDWTTAWDSPAWQAFKRSFARVCEGSRGKYFVGHPPLLVPNDLLSMLRGVDNFLMDLVSEPERVTETLKIMYENWLRMWNELDAIRDTSEGYGNWWPIWCPQRMRILQSDVSCMISGGMFEEFILPELHALTEDVDYGFYHLDGPDAIRHLEMICSVPKIRAIQWVPGAGNPGHGPHWMDLYKKVQSLGKAIWVSCRLEDVEMFVKELDPRHLLLTSYTETVEEAQQLKKKLVQWTREYWR